MIRRKLLPHYLIRVVFGSGQALHLASTTEPVWHPSGYLVWEPMEGPGYGDTLGMIEWPAVVAVSWRYHPYRTYQTYDDEAASTIIPNGYYQEATDQTQNLDAATDHDTGE